jgi:hypothetical protein
MIWPTRNADHQGEDRDKQSLRNSTSSYPRDGPWQATQASHCPDSAPLQSVPPVHSAMPMSERAIDQSTQERVHCPGLSCLAVTNSPSNPAGQGWTHSAHFPGEGGNYKRYYVVCHGSSCPYLGFKAISDVLIHLAQLRLLIASSFLTQENSSLQLRKPTSRDMTTPQAILMHQSLKGEAPVSTPSATKEIRR